MKVKAAKITFKAEKNNTQYPYTLVSSNNHLGDLRIGGRYTQADVQNFVDNPKFDVTIKA